MAARGHSPKNIGESSGREESSKLAALVNTALVGVPAAYVVSESVLVTVIAATVAVVITVAFLMYRRRR